MTFKVFETLLEPVFAIDENKKIVFCNEPAALLADSSVRKLCRSGVFDQVILFENNFDSLYPNLTQIDDATPYRELKFRNETGKEGKVQISIQKYAEKYWLIYFRDVTLEETLQKKYRKELEQKEDVIRDLENAKIELENYSKNLEQMVNERTAQVKELNVQMQALLNSLSQGFFIFTEDGLCLDVYSKACENTIETIPSKKMIWDVLKIESTKQQSIKKWIQTLFMELLPFNDLTELGPQTYPHSKGNNIKLDYYPIRNNDNKIIGVVTVATDITELLQAQKEAEYEKRHVRTVTSIMKNKKEFASFIRDSNELIKYIQNAFSTKIDFDEMYRYLHTFKGGAATFGAYELAESVHQCETYLQENNFSALENEFKKTVKQFLQFLSFAAQFVGQSIIKGESSKEVSIEILSHYFKKYIETSQNRNAILEWKNCFVLEPVGSFFNQYQDLVHEVAQSEYKKVLQVEFENSEILIEPEHYLKLFSTFVHIFRNSVDHGIESPHIRKENGKNEYGQLKVKFEVINNNLLFTFIDDGGGIDPQKIRSKLDAKGIDHSNLDDHQVIQHIFDSGVSTKDYVTDLSGRGVGMDAVLAVAKSMNGRAWVQSTLGKGTHVFVEVPYYGEHFNTNIRAA